MGDMKFDGTPEEWDALVGKNKVMRIDDINEVSEIMIRQNELIISDDDIDKAAMASMEEIYHSPNDTLSFYLGWNRAIKWYREQLKLKK